MWLLIVAQSQRGLAVASLGGALSQTAREALLPQSLPIPTPPPSTNNPSGASGQSPALMPAPKAHGTEPGGSRHPASEKRKVGMGTHPLPEAPNTRSPQGFSSLMNFSHILQQRV